MKNQFTKDEVIALKELAEEKIFHKTITSNEAYNKKHKNDPKRICDFLGDGKCNSKYGKNMKCDGIHTPDKCPWKNHGSYAMAVCDQANRRKR